MDVLAYLAAYCPAAVPVLILVALLQHWRISELAERVRHLEPPTEPDPAEPAGMSKEA